ncbi:hypothetical protein [Thermoflexibacter ruber]|uniref:Lipoprotein n=1 Tax=Thermoflexibacter ruber TaxID=1003 RepID=A0A1I2JQI4_9BACT|nr:hypothetical protein [Thermoflexibacter ruber]SFF56479.1 hypothetical protein SAMN04488541_105910 [Thermoflexibacter ruber]
MKKHLFIALLLFALFSGCRRAEEQVNAPVQADLAVFKAEFLGVNISIVESEKDSIFNHPTFGYKVEEGKKPEYIHTTMNLVQRNNTRIYLDLPTIRTEDFTFEGLKRILAVGKKEFETSPILGSDGTYNYAFKRGFIFTLSTQDPRLSEGGYRRLFDTMGNQTGSELRVTESKEIFPIAGYERGIQVRFLMTCKLYWGDQFIGDMKNAEFTLKFYYKKPDF